MSEEKPEIKVLAIRDPKPGDCPGQEGSLDMVNRILRHEGA